MELNKQSQDKIVKNLNDIFTTTRFATIILAISAGIGLLHFNLIIGSIILALPFIYLAFLLVYFYIITKQHELIEYEIFEQQNNWQVFDYNGVNANCQRSLKIYLHRTTKNIHIIHDPREIITGVENYRIADQTTHNGRNITKISLGFDYLAGSSPLPIIINTRRDIHPKTMDNSIIHESYCRTGRLNIDLVFQFDDARKRMLKTEIINLGSKLFTNNIPKLVCKSRPHWQISWDKNNLRPNENYKISWIWE